MNIIITGRHLELTDNLKGYAEEKIGKFKKSRVVNSMDYYDITRGK